MLQIKSRKMSYINQNIVEIKITQDYSIRNFLSKFYPNISELDLVSAINNGYKLVGLQEKERLAAIAEIYFYR